MTAEQRKSAAPRGAGERLLCLIKLIATQPRSFSLGELAERADLPASSIHRLLKILERNGFVERADARAYRPGRELHRIASLLLSHFDIGRAARPLLEALVRRHGETSVLCVYSPTSRRGIVAEVVLTAHPLRYNVERGIEISLPWGSLGRAILAHLPASEVEMVLRNENSVPLTGRPRPTRESLGKDLAHVREHGVAIFHDRHFDLAGVAGPVFNREGEVLGSLGVVMPSTRFGLHPTNELIGAVRDAARELSEQAAIAFG